MHRKSRIKHALNTTGIQWLKNVSIKHLSFLFYIEFFEPLKRFELFKNLLFFIFMSMNISLTRKMFYFRTGTFEAPDRPLNVLF